MKTVDFGLENAIAGWETKYPFLARSLVGATPAHSTKIEWLVDPPACDQDQLVAWWNWTQIVRNPFAVREGAMERALHDHLSAIENIVHHGHRGDLGNWTKCCGGATEFLGREPNYRDRLILRPLRDLTLRTEVNPRYGRTVENEWLTEFSLQVIPG